MPKFLFQKGNQFRKGKIPWNKGTKGVCSANSGSFKVGEKRHNKPHSEETKEKCRLATKKSWDRGIFDKRPSHSIETREKIRKTLHILGLNKGIKSRWWKGGTTTENSKIRNSFKYKTWRRKVFKRDDYTCQECGARGVYIEAHHIRSFAEFAKLRFKVSNGITFCLKCHAIIDKFRKLTIKKEI